MTRNTFLSAVATGILALSMGGNAMAADVTGGASATKKATAVTEPYSLQLHFAGAESVTFYQVGTLMIHKADGTTWKYRPTVTQTVNGKRKFLNADLRIVGKDRVEVKASTIDATAPVLVDGKGPNS